MKKVLIASTCCLCYGAQTAISKIFEKLENGENVVMLHEILHNKNVMQKLTSKGAKVIEDIHQAKEGDCVVICAHGEGKATFNYLKEHSINYVDYTCPNVKAIEELVKTKDSQGYKIIIVGKHGYDGKPMHAEVKGTMGWCNNPILIEHEREINKIDLSHKKYFLVIQTTFARNLAESYISEIQALMKKNNKIFEFKNTICNAQKQINNASVELCKQVDIMVVVGGKNSNNSKELFNNVSNYVPTVFVEDISSLQNLINAGTFKPYKTIGITAGASTMKEDVEQIKTILENLN